MNDHELIAQIAAKVMQWSDPYQAAGWDPLRNIAHMDAVLTKMRERGWWPSVYRSEKKGWKAWWWQSDDVDMGIGQDAGDNTRGMFRALLLAAVNSVEE